MKTLSLTSMIIGVLLFCAINLQAQSTKTHLNQVELMKQFIGTWKGEVGKDTIVIGVNNPFGSGLDCTSENPQNAILKWRFEFKSPDTIVQTALKNNIVYKVVTVTRVK